LDGANIKHQTLFLFDQGKISFDLFASLRSFCC